MSTPRVTILLWRPICIKSSFHCVRVAQCGLCVFYDTQRLLWVLAEFIFGRKTALLILSYTQTGTINRSHSQQTKFPYSHTVTQMCHAFVFGEPRALPGQRLPLWLCFLTESLLIRRAVLWSPIRSNPRLSGPSCRSCRMASLCVWGAWWERQWRVCGLIFISDLCQRESATPQPMSKKHIWLNLIDPKGEIHTGPCEKVNLWGISQVATSIKQG